MDEEKKKRRHAEANKKWYEANKEKKAEINKNWREKNPDKSREVNKKWYEDNKDKVRERDKKWQEANKEKKAEISKKWKADNKDKVNEYSRKYREDASNKLVANMRSRVRRALKGRVKKDRTMKLVGCTSQFLMDYLEKKFKPGMTWENYGEWHVDHIKPCASFDLTKEPEQRKCFHYTNLQPMWGQENMSKGAKY